MSGPADDFSERNKRAWAGLYRSTPELVWGGEPVGFLAPFLQASFGAAHRFSRVLDAGAGEGRNLPVLAQFGETITACDASSEALAKIPARSGLTRVACDLAATPFANGSFDLVLLCDVIETLPNPAPALREMRRLLAPGGRLVCNIPGTEDEIVGVEMTEVGPHRYLYRGRFYYQFLDEREATALLTQNGFAIERCELMRWTEAAHPEFRGGEHLHTSRVFLAGAAG